MGTFVLKPGEKYGLIIFPDVSVAVDLPENSQVASDLWVARKIPFDLPEHWKDWIGSLAVDKINNATLFLLTKKVSSYPEVLDADNEECKERVVRLYWGLFLTGFMHCYTEPYSLTGSNLDGEIDVRQLGRFSLPRFIDGILPENIDMVRLRNAALCANYIDSFFGEKRFDRFGRISQAFYGGVLNHNPANSLHQFVRCVEGFIYPDQGKTRKQFSSRTELFLGTQYHDFSGIIYDIRSSIEHMHDPFRTILGSTKREKRLTLVQKVVETEALARYCIYKLFINKNIRPYFETDENLSGFWKLNENERRKIWGDTLNLKKITDKFNPDLISDDDLGL